MIYQRININKLYEQAASDGKALDYNPNDEQKSASKKIKMNALYAFPIDESILNQINSMISSKVGVWKSETPLKLMKAGRSGVVATINGKPVYLMIRISDDKAERKDKANLDLELGDRVYVLFDTTAQELKKKIDIAANLADRVRVPVYTSLGTEQSLEFWREDTEFKDFKAMNREAAPKDSVKIEDGEEPEIKVDMKKQLQAPGTSAGITIED